MKLPKGGKEVFGAILGPLFLLVMGTGLHAQAPSPATPKTAGQKSKASSPKDPPKEAFRFEKEIQKIEKKAAPLPMGTVLFTGSSSIAKWNLADSFPAIQTANHGFGGSQAHELLQYAPRILIPFQPTSVVIYEGDNDIASGKTPAAISDSYQKLFDLIAKELPNTKVYVIAVKPSPSRIQWIKQQRELNTLLQKLCQGSKNMLFVDGFSPLLDEKGLPLLEYYLADNLHLSPKGYAKWTEVMTPLLQGR